MVASIPLGPAATASTTTRSETTTAAATPASATTATSTSLRARRGDRARRSWGRRRAGARWGASARRYRRTGRSPSGLEDHDEQHDEEHQVEDAPSQLQPLLELLQLADLGRAASGRRAGHRTGHLG